MVNPGRKATEGDLTVSDHRAEEVCPDQMHLRPSVFG